MEALLRATGPEQHGCGAPFGDRAREACTDGCPPGARRGPAKETTLRVTSLLALVCIRRLPTWRVMATRHPRRLLTRSARELDAFGGDYAGWMCAANYRAVYRVHLFGDSESPFTASEVEHDAETFSNYHITNPDHNQGVFASSCAVDRTR